MTYSVQSDAPGAFAFINTFYSLHASSGQKGIVLKRDDVTIAAVLYVEYNGSNLFMHVAAEPGRRWLTRSFLHEVYRYPFETLDCQRVTAWVDVKNHESRRFIEHMGWEPEARLTRAAGDGGDVIIYRMFKEDCRYG